MAKPKKEDPQVSDPTPVPVNRAMRSGMVKVRALSHLGEILEDGEIHRFAPGDEFEISPVRAESISSLVEVIT